MVRLQWSNKLGRKFRQDDLQDLAKPNWVAVGEAFQAGKTQEALDLIEYTSEMEQGNNDSLVIFVNSLLAFIGGLDEENIEKVLRQGRLPKIKEWLSTTPDVLESLQRCSELQRRHYGKIASITEEADRYVAVLDPCGTGGRLRRSCTAASTKKGYPWSWGKTGVPYYCIHCSLQWEIIPIELRGHPIRITEIGNRPEDPCVHLFYKKPEWIPEKYFTRVGKTKGGK
jgi:hypothetical protein